MALAARTKCSHLPMVLKGLAPFKMCVCVCLLAHCHDSLLVCLIAEGARFVGFQNYGYKEGPVHLRVGLFSGLLKPNGFQNCVFSAAEQPEKALCLATMQKTDLMAFSGWRTVSDFART